MNKAKVLGKNKQLVQRVLKPVSKKGATVSTAQVKKAVRKLEETTKLPKEGDTVSMAFHYAGLVSWEQWKIEKVAKGGEVVWIDNQLYEQKSDGTYVYEDYTLGPCKKVLHLDGGLRAKEEHNE